MFDMVAERQHQQAEGDFQQLAVESVHVRNHLESVLLWCLVRWVKRNTDECL